MDKQFFENKIRMLTDAKLQDLLRVRYDTNQMVVDLAIEEAKRRNIQIPPVAVPPERHAEARIADMKTLQEWNWGAFRLAPFWTLSNKLEKWTIVTLIPFVNLIAVIYLGLKGNRLVYEKSQMRNIGDFMTIQRIWNRWAIAIIWIVLGTSLIALIMYGLAA